MKIPLFVHGAKLARRSEGYYQEAAGKPTVFKFEASNVVAELVSFGDTSPFHDLPDGATVYVEIGVDLATAQREVARAAEEFVKHRKRPKFVKIPPTAPQEENNRPDWWGKCRCYRPG